MIRNILAVITAYALFAVSSVLLFTLTGHRPHHDAPLAFKLMTIVYGLFFAILSGLLLQVIAGQKKLTVNFILVAVIFSLAAISLLTSRGSHWTQLYAMFLFAPSSILGGYLRNRFTSTK